MIIWLASYPKSGNTWIRSIVNQIIHNDFKKKDEVFDGLFRIRRYPSKFDIKDLPELSSFNNFTKDQKKKVIDHTVKNWIKSQEKINLNSKVNIFKTHNMLCNINLDGKTYSFTDINNSIGVIHVVRDPRNVITSVKKHFSHQREEETVEMLLYQYNWTGFADSDVPQLLSSWGNHYNSWKKFPKNNLLIRYEDMISNTKVEIRRLVNYLSNYFKLDMSEKNLDDIISNTSFENFKEQEKKGNFKENSTNKKTGEKNVFFNLGPNNRWEKILKKESINKIEKIFRKEMKELGYL